MSSKTSDNSQFCKVEWFEWVLFCIETALFPDDVLKLGHYLGPTIDVSLAMTTMILTKNRPVLHRSTYRQLTSDELSAKDGSDTKE